MCRPVADIAFDHLARAGHENLADQLYGVSRFLFHGCLRGWKCARPILPGRQHSAVTFCSSGYKRMVVLDNAYAGMVRQYTISPKSSTGTFTLFPVRSSEALCEHEREAAGLWSRS